MSNRQHHAPLSLRTLLREKGLGQSQRRRRFVFWWLSFFGPECHYCGREMRQAEKFETALQGDVATFDHVVPRCRGGENAVRVNGHVICYRCNQAKGEMTHDEFLHYLDGQEVAA